MHEDKKEGPGKIDTKKIDIPNAVLEEWQDILTYIAIRLEMPCALIMRIDLPDIRVFVASKSESNPYHVGESECLLNSGLYCEEVFKTKQRLQVDNALDDPRWRYNPDIKLGMVSYLGFPILWPDGEVFGTICVLDAKENHYPALHEELMSLVKKYVETYLDLAVLRYSTEQRRLDPQEGQPEILRKEKVYDSLFIEIDHFLHKDVMLKAHAERLRKIMKSRAQEG